MKKEHNFHSSNIIFITLGAAIYAFGFVNFNMANHIAEGGWQVLPWSSTHFLGLIRPIRAIFLIYR